MKETDVLVVGAGPAGYVAAVRLGRLGKKVVLADKDKLGGECLHYGCIPSKALLNASWLSHRAGRGLQPGVVAENVKVDLPRLQAWKTQLVGGLSTNIGMLAKSSGVEVVFGAASFTSGHEARIEGEKGKDSVRFAHAVVCTGTRPVALPGLELDGTVCLSSRQALDLQEVPAKLLVVGAGAIGLEMATFWAKLGSEVTVVELMPQVLPGLETDLVSVVSRGLQRLGVTVLTGSKVKSSSAGQNGASRQLVLETPEGEKSLEADKIIVSVGRAPSTEGLGLGPAGVKTDAKGHIVVDKTCRTSAAHIYAAGDITGTPYLAHKASREALTAACAIAGKPTHELGAIPMAVFTDPEVASVGRTDTQAREAGIETVVGRFPFAACGRAQAMRETEGFVKVVAEKDSHKLLGVSIVGAHASELISEASLALRLGAKLEDVAHTIHPHPTLPEAFREACEVALGEAVHVLRSR